jgi:hypothetical protein
MLNQLKREQILTHFMLLKHKIRTLKRNLQLKHFNRVQIFAIFYILLIALPAAQFLAMNKKKKTQNF